MWLPTPAAGEAVFGVAMALPPLAAALVDPLRCPAQRRAFAPHITLVGPFTFAKDAIVLLDRHLADVAASTAPFSVRLRGTATFLPVTPVAYLRVDDAASAHLRALEAALRTGPLDIAARFPFVPHVTLAMEHEPAQLESFLDRAASTQVDFTAHEFGLYRFEGGTAGPDRAAGETSSTKRKPGGATALSGGSAQEGAALPVAQLASTYPLAG